MSKHSRSRAALPVDGTERETVEGRTFPARNPATGEVLWQVPDAAVDDMRDAVAAARRAFSETTWSTDTALRRTAVHQLRQALVARADELVLLMAVETGVPVALRAQHLDAAIAGFGADPTPLTPGVTAVITPATSPLAVAIAEVGRVIAAGGSVVLKPAVEASSAAVELGRIALDILPRGVLNVVTTRDVDVAIELTRDRRIDAISFTGSTFVGERVRDTAERAGARVRLDTAGPVTIRAADDDRLAEVVSDAATAVAANAGQGCRLPTAVVVPVRRHAEALAAAKAAMASVVVGDPTDPATVCGPLRSPVARDRVLRYVALARAESGDIALGGHVPDRRGWWMSPTVIGGLAQGSRLVSEELLGPVLMVVPDSSTR